MHSMAPCSPRIPFDRETIEWLDQRPGASSRPGKPTRTSTRPTNSTAGLQWYDTAADKEYDDQADRDKLARLIDDDFATLASGEPVTSRRAGARQARMPGRSRGSWIPHRRELPELRKPAHRVRPARDVAARRCLRQVELRTGSAT